MSSAILYLAIIAIWVCVLIPRWLRRDSSSSRGLPQVSVTAITTDPVSDDEEDFSGEEDHRPSDSAPPEQDGTPPPLTREESRRRMMAARRRLLGMLIALETAAIGLAVLGFAALWVVIPPTVMFAGYLLLLREAAHADTEQARREEEAEWARARARERARARAEGRAATLLAAPTAPVAPTAPPASAQPAVGFEDSGPGRDFAPGLAGKYTTSVPGRGDEDFYDQYTQNRLRAVGD